MTSARLPDAAPANWVDRHAPERLRPWLKLGRFDRPTGIWLLMLPAWQGIALAAAMRGAWPSPRLLGLFAAGSALMRAAGCAFNDIVDRDIDGRVARTAARPIASGQISIGGAWVFIVACSLVSLAILLSLNLMSLFLGVASLALVGAYPFMKRITWWPQAWLGLTFNWGALLGFAAARGGPASASVLILAAGAIAGGAEVSLFTPGLPWAALLLYASGIAWTLGYDTIYAVQDIEDDALAGVKSSARRLGPRAPRAVLAFYAASLGFALAAWRIGGLGWGFLPPALLYAAQLAWQARRLKLDDPALALRLFKSNLLAGMALFVAIIAGHWRG
ncbi:MAG TPA: UbiA family prenyltransferase [Caulobacteraceae bacterium]